MHDIGARAQTADHLPARGQLGILPYPPLVFVARVCALERDRLRPRFDGDVEDASKRNVADMRTLEVSPAQVQPHAIFRNAFQRVIHGFDVHVGNRPEVVDALAREDVQVPTHRQIRRIQLQDETRVDDGTVFMLHGIGHREDVRLVVGVVVVLQEVPDNPGRSRGHERVDWVRTCLLYNSDAADDLPCVDLGGRRILKKQQNVIH